MQDVQMIISKMTLEEKASLCSGQDFWHTEEIPHLGIPQLMMSDGPHGLRKQESEADHLGLNESIAAVCFPAGCATGSSFDVELMEQLGDILGKECQAENIGMLLGPAVNIKRSPLCGRNFEYMSEDPYLTGKMAASYINGLQKNGVGASIKHFAANSQEYRRMSSSSELSERTLREIYLPAFEEAVKSSQPKTVMCSYNKINGVFASENKELMTKILREEWGFEGAVVTDWGAINDRVKGLKAGVDLEMPGTDGYNDRKIIEAVKNGTLDEQVVDQAVERILNVIFFCRNNEKNAPDFNKEADHEKAVQIESECAVLLENNGVLPLNKDEKILYIGEFAEKPRYQGGGSSHINSFKKVSALESAKQKQRSVSYIKGFSADKDEYINNELFKAVEAAKQADKVVIFAGLPDIMESEGYDRKTLAMPECQNEMIEEVLKVQPNTVIVLHNGSPVETPWAEKSGAVLEMYLGGQGVGEACDRILYGEVNPSGRLAESFPYRLEDTPSYLFYPGDGKKAIYGEEIFVGYRYYDTKKIPVRWAFGHGLSYTSFTYSNIRLSTKHLTNKEQLIVEVDISNIGDVDGKEVVQLYISDKCKTVLRPAKELKGFKKIFLKKGETQTVSFEIDERDLAYYEEEIQDWYAPSGTYEILVGQASDNIILSEEFDFITTKYLPLSVDGTTTVGDLLKDVRTSVLSQELFSGIINQNSGESEEISAADKEMIEAILENVPLKSLVSLGAITNREQEQIENKLNSVLRGEEENE
ncbi:glycoside hydrolase family 3 C-terminal domain-containing protein [Enterococcus casseliflavus]|uniref:glycoside hydrolase family 3 C-terminal domain-containing protein n=1 Tax=Enterococcus casseliflavus TaxID=37734 RepID=UPI0022DF8964|nr:glycoside hydrolase family 3 C-terminal domain-containing protein [Enterococcus casseliflavus]